MSLEIFKNKQVLITGASRGIGAAIASAFAKLGADLFLLAFNEERLQAKVSELATLYPACKISSRAVDLSQPEKAEQTLREIQSTAGAVNIVVNNAGIYRTASVAGHDLKLWRETMDTNLTSALLTMSIFLPGMLEAGWGRVINISSISGQTAEAHGSAYSASKFAMIGLSQAAALETANRGVTVNAVCPGWVKTDLSVTQIESPQWRDLTGMPGTAEDSMDFTLLSVPQERFIEVEEVADLVTYLAGESARGITGQAINICGGLSI